MRNFLLAATAIFGVSVGLSSLAAAQTTTTTTTTSSPTFAFPSFSESAAGNGPAQPGTVTVRLRARLWFDAGVGSDSFNTTTVGTGQVKTQRLYFGEFARLYPGFDGVAANGLQYGAALEVRQNSGGASPASGSPTLYWRREVGYVGLPALGRIRFGQGDAAIGLFMTGTMEAFDYNGGWNGDAPGFLSSNAQLSWTFPEDGGFYTPTKVVYLSPRFAGFDFGVSYEPNNQVSTDAVCGTPQSGTSTATTNGGSFPGCGTTVSAPGGLNRRTNMYDAVARYTGAFGPIGLTVTGGYIGSGVVNNSTGPTAYKGLDVIDSGAVVTFGGLSVGGHITTGNINANGGLVPSGTRKGFNWIAGATYAVGPLIFGGHYLDEDSSGAQTATNKALGVGRLREEGVAVGASFDYAPGATVLISGLWGHRQQNNYDLVNGGVSPLRNKVDGRAIEIGNVFRW